MTVPFHLVGDLAKTAQALLELAIEKGNDRVVLFIRGMRIEIHPNDKMEQEDKNEL
jgi:hypothetical protein